MGVHAGQLALKSDLRLVQEYRRSLLPCLEQARRPTLDHHVYRSSGLGVWVLISENWYETVVITLDEMWHFLKKRLASSGFGARMTLSLAAPSPGCLVAVMTPPRPSPGQALSKAPR